MYYISAIPHYNSPDPRRNDRTQKNRVNNVAQSAIHSEGTSTQERGCFERAWTWIKGKFLALVGAEGTPFKVMRVANLAFQINNPPSLGTKTDGKQSPEDLLREEVCDHLESLAYANHALINAWPKGDSYRALSEVQKKLIELKEIHEYLPETVERINSLKTFIRKLLQRYKNLKLLDLNIREDVGGLFQITASLQKSQNPSHIPAQPTEDSDLAKTMEYPIQTNGNPASAHQNTTRTNPEPGDDAGLPHSRAGVDGELDPEAVPQPQPSTPPIDTNSPKTITAPPALAYGQSELGRIQDIMKARLDEFTAACKNRMEGNRACVDTPGGRNSLYVETANNKAILITNILNNIIYKVEKGTSLNKKDIELFKTIQILTSRPLPTGITKEEEEFLNIVREAIKSLDEKITSLADENS